MSEINADFDAVVMEFMEDYPMTATYRTQVDGAYDPATGTTSFTTVDTEVEAILLDLTLSSNGLSTRHGTMVVAGDKQLIVRPPEKTDPLATPIVINTATDRVIVFGQDYKVVTYKEINPTGNDVILFDLYLRR